MKREELAAAIVDAGRKMIAAGLVAGTWGNISARVDENSFLITPSGVPYDLLRPEQVVEVGMDGSVRPGQLKPSTEFSLHAAIYAARPDVGGIVHTHSPYATAFAVAGRNLPPVTEELAQLVGGEVAVAPYALPGSRELAAGAVAALGEKNAVLLAAHGLVGVGRDVAEALLVCQVVEKTAFIYSVAAALGEPRPLPAEEVKLLYRFYREKYGQRP
ncbi:MAG: L-fuculose-phosphate aldolase [Eubacteriales bacterium]|nr:L-fuculose-phosphate aldolase [Eubacteriales bacterium]